MCTATPECIYDPTTGTFLSPDPVDGQPGTPDEANPYDYVGNDPLNFVDPLGLCRTTDVVFGPYQNEDPNGGLSKDECHNHPFVGCQGFRAVVCGPADVGIPECRETGIYTPPAIEVAGGGADAAWSELSRQRDILAARSGRDRALWAAFAEPNIDVTSPEVMHQIAEGARRHGTRAQASSSAVTAGRAARVISRGNTALETISIVLVLNDSLRAYSCTGDALASIDMAAEGVGTAASAVAGAEMGATAGAAACAWAAVGAIVCATGGAIAGGFIGAGLFQWITAEIRDTDDCTLGTIAFCFMPPRR